MQTEGNQTCEIPLTIRVGEDDYDVNPAAETKDIIFYPHITGDVNLRKLWYMRRRPRPKTPAPSNTPLPDKQKNQEDKARLFSLYMRPWVLDRRFANDEVPFIADLNVIPVAQPKACLLYTSPSPRDS